MSKQRPLPKTLHAQVHAQVRAVMFEEVYKAGVAHASGLVYQRALAKALRRRRAGRPPIKERRALIERARAGVPGHPHAKRRAALAYVVLLAKGTPSAKAAQQALARPPKLSHAERQQVLALEATARRMKKNRLT